MSNNRRQDLIDNARFTHNAEHGVTFMAYVDEPAKKVHLTAGFALSTPVRTKSGRGWRPLEPFSKRAGREEAAEKLERFFYNSDWYCHLVDTGQHTFHVSRPLNPKENAAEVIHVVREELNRILGKTQVSGKLGVSYDAAPSKPWRRDTLFNEIANGVFGAVCVD